MTELPTNDLPERIIADRKNATTKNAKPLFDDVLKVLVDLVDRSRAKDVVPQILRVLKTGFKEDVKPEHVDAVLGILLPCPLLSRLGVRLAIEGPQRGAQIMVALRNRLRARFIEATGYPVDSGASGDRFFELSEWIKQGDSMRQPDDFRHPDEWVRRAFYCLATEPDHSIRVGAIHRLLSVFARTSSSKAEGAVQLDDRSYLREVTKLLSGKQLGVQRIATSLLFGYPLEDQRKRDQQSMSALRLETAAMVERAVELEVKIARVQEELRLMSDREAALSTRCSEAELRLEEERQKRDELTAHWQRESEQRLIKLRHSLSSQLSHDLQEARLCLDRAAPNVGMALSRIQQMEVVVRGLEQIT